MAIKVNTHIFNALMQIFKGYVFDTITLQHPEVVAWYFRSVKDEETATWIEQNPAQYKAGLLAGFEVDNSQKAQLRDIKTKENI